VQSFAFVPACASGLLCDGALATTATLPFSVLLLLLYLASRANRS
jgi:hypothetical protein